MSGDLTRAPDAVERFREAVDELKRQPDDGLASKFDRNFHEMCEAIERHEGVRVQTDIGYEALRRTSETRLRKSRVTLRSVAAELHWQTLQYRRHVQAGVAVDICTQRIADLEAKAEAVERADAQLKKLRQANARLRNALRFERGEFDRG